MSAYNVGTLKNCRGLSVKADTAITDTMKVLKYVAWSVSFFKRTRTKTFQMKSTNYISMCQVECDKFVDHFLIKCIIRLPY